MTAQASRYVVIGGGVSGLAAANRILELQPKSEVILLEAGPRLGGVLRTERRSGFLIEYGAENFITSLPWGIRLCKKIGFVQELVSTNETHRRAFVLHSGRLKPIPAGFAIMAPSRLWPVLSSRLWSPMGKLRLAGELLVRRRKDNADESLASFVRRRLGRQTYDRLVQPLVGGIYMADPEKLSVDATMPRFRQMEQQSGSLILGMLKQRAKRNVDTKQASGARYSQFVAPREGMSSLIESLAARLASAEIRLNSSVEHISKLANDQWRVQVAGPRPDTFVADGVVLALPAKHSARLLSPIDKDLACDLAGIEYGSCALATFGFHRSQVRHPLDGFGVVIPIIQRRKIVSATFSSTKYPGRAPDGHVLIRTYIGGACQPELLDQDDDRLLSMAFNEIRDLLGIDGSPVLSHINRQTEAMPQYHVGHLARTERVMQRAEQLAGLVLAGNSLQGVGIPQCIHAAEMAVESLLARAAPREESIHSSFS